MKTLVAGWFSFSGMGATAGDLMARDVVCDWLDEADVAYDVALDPPFTSGPGGAAGVDWRAADPRHYARVVFVCGPFGNGPPAAEFLAHFAHGVPWAHVDIAGVAAVAKPGGWRPRGMSGFGARLLVDTLERVGELG